MAAPRFKAVWATARPRAIGQPVRRPARLSATAGNSTAPSEPACLPGFERHILIGA